MNQNAPQRLHDDGRVLVPREPQPELPVVAVAPGQNAAVVLQRDGVERARGERDDASDAAELGGRARRRLFAPGDLAPLIHLPGAVGDRERVHPAARHLFNLNVPARAPERQPRGNGEVQGHVDAVAGDAAVDASLAVLVPSPRVRGAVEVDAERVPAAEVRARDAARAEPRDLLGVSERCARRGREGGREGGRSEEASSQIRSDPIRARELKKKQKTTTTTPSVLPTHPPPRAASSRTRPRCPAPACRASSTPTRTAPPARVTHALFLLPAHSALFGAVVFADATRSPFGSFSGVGVGTAQSSAEACGAAGELASPS